MERTKCAQPATGSKAPKEDLGSGADTLGQIHFDCKRKKTKSVSKITLKTHWLLQHFTRIYIKSVLNVLIYSPIETITLIPRILPDLQHT